MKGEQNKRGMREEKPDTHINESPQRADHPSARSVLIQDPGSNGGGQRADDFLPRILKPRCISETSSPSLPPLKIHAAREPTSEPTSESCGK